MELEERRTVGWAKAGSSRRAHLDGRGIRHPHVVLELRHVLFRRCFFGKRPRQHELASHLTILKSTSACYRQIHLWLAATELTVLIWTRARQKLGAP
jgi:hypothetical protein